MSSETWKRLKGPIVWSLDVVFDASPNNLLNKRLSCRWFDSTWRHCNYLYAYLVFTNKNFWTSSTAITSTTNTRYYIKHAHGLLCFILMWKYQFVVNTYALFLGKGATVEDMEKKLVSYQSVTPEVGFLRIVFRRNSWKRNSVEHLGPRRQNPSLVSTKLDNLQ